MRWLTAALTAFALVTAPLPARAAASGELTIKVMSFNILYGGDDLDLSTGDFCATPDGCGATLDVVAEAIRRSGADVVGVQEPERNTERLAAKLGWHGSNRAHVMSRWPIIDPPGADSRYVYVTPRPGKVVAIANTHLPSDPYGPYALRDGSPVDEVMALERETRMPALRPLLRTLTPLADQGVPVVLTGDFNTPSHLDSEIPWPVSKALARAGFTDSYRAAHPDPAVRPGLTWTPGSPEGDPREVHDRIDWVLHAGPARTLASTVVGEPGNPDAGVRIGPFPSDHRGVVSTLRVRPATPPVLAAPDTRRLTISTPLRVRFHAPTGARVQLSTPDGKVVADAPVGSRRDGLVVLGTARAAHGENTVSLVARSGQVLSSTPVWAYPPGSPTTVTATMRPGGSVAVRWTNAPGMALDWIGIYECTEVCAPDTEYLSYDYTSSRVDGRLAVDVSELPPGDYVARLLADDGLRSVAESERFTVPRGTR